MIGGKFERREGRLGTNPNIYHFSYGYALKERASYVGVHYTTVNRAVSAGMGEM